MKYFAVFVAVLMVATAVYARDEMSGTITAIDPAKGALEVSGIKILTKDAKIQGIVALIPSKLEKYKVGDKVQLEGEFTGKRVFKASKVEPKIFKHYGIEGTLHEVKAKDRVLEISGITVKVPEGVEIEGDKGNITLDKLVRGRRVDVEGQWTGKAQFTADSVEMEEQEEKKACGKKEEKEKD